MSGQKFRTVAGKNCILLVSDTEGYLLIKSYVIYTLYKVSLKSSRDGRMEQMTNAQSGLFGKTEGKRPL